MSVRKLVKKILPWHTARGKSARRVWKYIRKITQKKEKRKGTSSQRAPLIMNINRDMTRGQKRVLISYTISPFSAPFSTVGGGEKGIFPHAQIYEIYQIIRYFISRDFIVDIIDRGAACPVPELENVSYDFIFGLGEVFRYMAKNNPDVNNCIYATGNSPDFEDERLTERIDYYYERHKTEIPVEKPDLSYKNELFSCAKNALVLGIAGLYEKYNYQNVVTINPTGMRNGDFTEHCPITDNIKKSFLWFGSTGAVHKGLDILIEIAEKNSDFELHICGLSEEFLFEETISRCKNIHNHGTVNVAGREFVDIVNSVTFMVFPSCSEGMSTSCLTVARHGVLLLLLRNSGMDRHGDYAFWLEDFKVDYVEKRMREVSELDNDFLTQKSRELQKYADEEYCLEKFSENFGKAMDEILDTQQHRLPS